MARLHTEATPTPLHFNRHPRAYNRTTYPRSNTASRHRTRGPKSLALSRKAASAARSNLVQAMRRILKPNLKTIPQPLDFTARSYSQENGLDRAQALTLNYGDQTLVDGDWDVGVGESTEYPEYNHYRDDDNRASKYDDYWELAMTPALYMKPLNRSCHASIFVNAIKPSPNPSDLLRLPVVGAWTRNSFERSLEEVKALALVCCSTLSESGYGESNIVVEPPSDDEDVDSDEEVDDEDFAEEGEDWILVQE
ncbi:MAG: hypothetical protein NXY57DRAFT_965518 [Lentinula lateritia]|uniref:Uncharacterized protein n=1 Tax=Lentinula lateritia TaxID=40482 RepID=A0ABQ8VYH9_9AGAR|nr:MAG: hypothetical protein NXY57DRAFT_965518 [Lentinula lateritia]KAJ4501369.1 hypothetical protein C8R41DRAFT_807111 [Lentinula lateritia]